MKEVETGHEVNLSRMLKACCHAATVDLRADNARLQKQVAEFSQAMFEAGKWHSDLSIDNARLREALAWYADEKNYRAFYDEMGDGPHAERVLYDRGEHARRALDPPREGGR